MESYVTTMLTETAKYEKIQRKKKVMGETFLNAASLNKWLTDHFDKQEEESMRRLYLDPVEITPEVTERTREYLIKLASSILAYFKKPGIDKDPALYRRACFQLAVTLGHEMSHAINFLRFSGSRIGKDFEDKEHIFHSVGDPQAEEGNAWEMSTFGYLNACFPGTEDRDDVVPNYGLSAHNWAEGLGNESTWVEIERTNEIPKLDLTSTLQARATRKRRSKTLFTYELLPPPDLPETVGQTSTAQTIDPAERDRSSQDETGEDATRITRKQNRRTREEQARGFQPQEINTTSKQQN
ncbi:uncharacterized protein BDZ99DRAFT_284659 [Mytilinidion resinicola]|uniref:Uncharacterized protein n=1 Tax=Mytilinidion resinicola TaxID=574789 RepID=A0A6A6YSS9_9PEZI|nr:uncharacterized protein BDZ99DRAFT_284659 [Mytilinidion resinicola]KAF2811972.1 hypothetical protein BDZ99DRAFT_284659 [Mytilinidion resinicola]